MPTFIAQGRYAPDAIRGMVTKPEDRSEAVAALAKSGGGKLISHYLTFGEYDFLVILEMPDGKAAAAVALAAAAGGSITGMRTFEALTAAEAQQAFKAAGALVGKFRSAGKG